MALMGQGMTFTLHHSSDLGEDDGVGGAGGSSSVLQFHTWTLP